MRIGNWELGIGNWELGIDAGTRGRGDAENGIFMYGGEFFHGDCYYFIMEKVCAYI
ncbi:MAG: hypothetical protein F6K47_32540 [Symploca sp. SIO2E6]|nr:hypothetical protein [Symploca sp. SIO2E6]